MNILDKLNYPFKATRQQSVNKFNFFFTLTRASQYSPRNCEISVKTVIPLFHFDHPLAQVPKSPYFIHSSENAIIFIYTYIFFGGGGVGFNIAVCLEKVPKASVFELSQF